MIFKADTEEEKLDMYFFLAFNTLLIAAINELAIFYCASNVALLNYKIRALSLSEEEIEKKREDIKSYLFFLFIGIMQYFEWFGLSGGSGFFYD